MILLDTCTLLWLVLEPSKLSGTAKVALEENAGAIHVSAITAFEIGQKHAAGKLELPFSPREWFRQACQAHVLIVVLLSEAHAFAATALPLIHRDPFDRLLIATAQVQQFILLTPDPLIRNYTQATIVW